MVKCHHMIPFALMVGAIIMIALLLRSVFVILAVMPFAKYLNGETHAVATIATGIIFASDIDAVACFNFPRAFHTFQRKRMDRHYKDTLQNQQRYNDD